MAKIVGHGITSSPSSLSRRKSFKIASALSIFSKPSTLGDYVSSTGFKAPELRCVKYSPSVKPRAEETSCAKYDFENLMWLNAFNHMGKLKVNDSEEDQSICKMNPAPYHCSPVARVFKTTHGVQTRHEMSTEKDQNQIKKTLPYLSIAKVHLPAKLERSSPEYVPKWLLYGLKKPTGLYLPPSAVRARWGPEVVTNVDIICDWLIRKFGPFLFIIREGPKSMVVVYEDVWRAYNVVNAGIPPRIFHVSWCDPRFNNFGHFKIFDKYTVSNDQIWLQSRANMFDRYNA